MILPVIKRHFIDASHLWMRFHGSKLATLKKWLDVRFTSFVSRISVPLDHTFTMLILKTRVGQIAVWAKTKKWSDKNPLKISDDHWIWFSSIQTKCSFRSGPNRYLPNSARNTKCEINFNWMSHRWGESFCRSVNRQQLSFHSHFSINWSRSKKSKNLTGVRSSRDKQIIKREKQETEKEITQRKPKPNLKI